MKQNEVLEKAYGNIPKEVGVWFDFSFIGSRTIKYYLIKIIRWFTR